MKKIGITLLLISLAGMALFAEGTQEEQAWEPGMSRGYTSGNQMPMNNNYPNQNFQGRGQMPMKGGMNANNGSWRPSGMAYTNQSTNVENITLTGNIDLTDTNLPKLTVGENTYELMVPYRLDYDIDIKNGDEITIIGFEVPAYRRAVDSESTNLMVTGATFNGTDYNLNMMNIEPMAYGQRAAMMNNHGPVNSRHGKPGRFTNSRFYYNSMNQGPQQNNMTNRPYGRR